MEMPDRYGWAGKILYVDLTRRATRVESLDPYLSFIGGRGINQWLLFNMVDRKIDPLSPENVVLLGAGPFVGTPIPSACRLAVDFKNVITGGVGSANAGGRFASAMKFAGYDHIVIQGKADRPIYLLIRDQEIFFRNAAEIWGQDTWKLDSAIKERENSPQLSTLGIGLAGENLVKFACLIGDQGRAAAYGGSGAIFGSKNLKAVAIVGSNRAVNVARPVEFMMFLKKFREEIFDRSRAVRVHREGGTLGAYLLPGENRPHGVRNLNEDFWSDQKLSKVSRQEFDKFLVRRHSCFGCPVACSAIFDVKGYFCEGIQANSLRAFGTNMDVTDPEDILNAHGLCNKFGLDTDHTSAIVSWAIDCFEKGIINQKDTDGLVLRFGDGKCVAELIQRIANRHGFGNILAEGIVKAAEAIGRKSEELAAVVKKNAVMEAGIRTHKGWALGIVTSARGSSHLRGASGLEFQKIPGENSQNALGVGEISDPTSYSNKADLVVWQERYKGVIDMVGLCALVSMWMDITLYKPEDISQFMGHLTGKDISAAMLMEAGEKIVNIERSFNLLHAGFGRAEDQPPKKFVEIGVNKGPYEGERLDFLKWNKMLDEYYDIHGWDKKTGWPTKKTLIDLGLQQILEKLIQQDIDLPEEGESG
jgi:aldehyde:ferredoxin oxidoreductase